MGIFFCVFTFLAIRYIDPKSILISSYMSLFKKAEFNLQMQQNSD